jgi:hypothetical protein
MPETMLSPDDRRYILWDRKDGPAPPRDQQTGEFLTSGCLGQVSVNNVYLTSYARWPDWRRPYHLPVGSVIPGVRFCLSGERGEYDIYRVR